MVQYKTCYVQWARFIISLSHFSGVEKSQKIAQKAKLRNFLRLFGDLRHSLQNQVYGRFVVCKSLARQIYYCDFLNSRKKVAKNCANSLHS